MSISLINKTESGHVLSRKEAELVMEELLTGRVETADIVRLLTAMNARPVRVEELAGFATVMRRHAAPVFANGEKRLEHLVDTCGTGGKGFSSFNISTAAAIVAAAAGARVAKHGNRASHSGSGSADVIEALGVRIDLPIEHHGRALRAIGIGFFFARAAHAATRHAAPARKQIGVRTIFNLLGPLTNPAGAKAQVVGVPSAELIDLVAGTLAELATEHAFVVHGEGGLDEISLAGETLVAEVKGGRVRRFTVRPEDFDVSHAPIDAARGGTAQENAAAIREILAGKSGPQRDIVVANAAAALVAADMAVSFLEGARMATMVLDSGAAEEKLLSLAEFTKKEAWPEGAKP
ncbi:MAG TPA: anthranilate phosphoribosyltransferase [Candidatus Methylomirabilis sp.]|nr:anthranilate phosphoribosyltransferase [Candidatus Methylomirabilis sp.]